MSLPNKLQMGCKKCRVSTECPSNGSSPLKLGSGRSVLCKLVGGYGQTPIPESKMSEESKVLAKEHGPCLTIAEVPTIDEDSGKLYFKIVKVWSQPQLHSRQTTTMMMDRMYPRSHK